MVTSAADLGDHQTKPNKAYDISFWKRQTKNIEAWKSVGKMQGNWGETQKNNFKA